MSLLVYAHGRRAGTLDMEAGEPFYGFIYSQDYLALPDAVPLSLSLPLREERFSGAQSLPFFEGLLPEGDVRASMAKQLGISENSPAKLLRALGRDCAGDVAVLEEDDPYQPPANDKYLLLDEDLGGIARNPYGTISRLRAGNRLSLAGGQEKIALYHDARESMSQGWYVPMHGSPSTHIVKPQVNEAYPQLVYNEFLCMRLAGLIGMQAAEVEMVVLGRPLLVVRRFDRWPTGETSEEGLALFARLRQEDFCQALGVTSAQKYEQDGGPGVAAVCEALLTHSASALDDRSSLLRLLAFNYLVGNCDAHGKNYSIMLGSKEAVRLAPAYDLLSTTVYDGEFGAELSRGMGMRIGAHSNIDRIGGGDFALLAEEVGVSKRYLLGILHEVADGVASRFDDAAQMLADVAAEDVSQLVERMKAGIDRRSEAIG